ncbi:hypothetical protein ABW20_dc0105185 [Dactylellina cionopaga]|nr:hypothetical protein ABW20_dc0105185 [Dactylellina cionopaga]
MVSFKKYLLPFITVFSLIDQVSSSPIAPGKRSGDGPESSVWAPFPVMKQQFIALSKTIEAHANGNPGIPIIIETYYKDKVDINTRATVAFTNTNNANDCALIVDFPGDPANKIRFRARVAGQEISIIDSIYAVNDILWAPNPNTGNPGWSKIKFQVQHTIPTHPRQGENDGHYTVGFYSSDDMLYLQTSVIRAQKTKQQNVRSHYVYYNGSDAGPISEELSAVYIPVDT